MRTYLSFFILCLISLYASGQSNTTPEYKEVITAYQELAAAYPKVCKLLTGGATDSGKPLHLFVIDPTGYFKPTEKDKRNMPVCLIMNGIHPGEPCGINASIAFVREKVANPDKNVVYCIIPVYNIGGALNRNSHSRANQNGPESYGFRGNAKNLDLNRDFIKCDSKNALSFTALFQEWRPEVFIDTHTSNGADYQPNITLISSFPEKLIPMQAKFLEMEFEPFLYNNMKEKGDEMIPYVNVFGKSPDGGIEAFTDLPRYSMGYTSLFNTISFTTEAHMLKPFDQRVASTLNFLNAMSTFLVSRGDILVEMKKVADARTAEMKSFKYNWKLTSSSDSIEFPGFKADSVLSEVTGLYQLVYLRDEPYRKNIPYYHTHEGQDVAKLPESFLIPQAYDDVITRLKMNQIKVDKLKQDTLIEVTSTYIDSFKTVDYPYEGHYLHYNTSVIKRKQKVQFYAGDYFIKTKGQESRRYLAQVLTPEAEDSFFNWGFFDSSLGQKEYFSSYVYDETARMILERNPSLRRAFEAKRQADFDFSQNARAQLEYIYVNSENYEITHKRLPVFEVGE